MSVSESSPLSATVVLDEFCKKTTFWRSSQGIQQACCGYPHPVSPVVSSVCGACEGGWRMAAGRMAAGPVGGDQKFGFFAGL